MTQLDEFDEQERELRRVALQNASNILAVRQRVERELLAAQEALRESHARTSSILESITDGFVVLDDQWRFTYLNNRAEEFLRPLGKSRDNLIGKCYWSEFPELLGTEIERQYRRSMQDRVVVDFEDFYSPLNAWFAMRGYPSRNGLTIYFQDITKRKQADAFLAAERKVLGMIATGQPLREVLDCLTRETESLSVDGLLCSVLLIDEDGTRLRHGSAPSLPTAYNEMVDGLCIGPAAGSCGTAAYQRCTITVTDIAVDPLWAAYRDLAAANRLAACTSTPIISSQGKLLGTIAMYYRVPRGPSPRDVDLIELARHLGSIAIERQQREDALREETRVLELLYQTGSSIASNLDLQELLQTVTDAATQLIDAKFGAFFYNELNGDGESFRLFTLTGAPRDAFEKFGLPRNTPIFDPTFRGQSNVRSADITQDERYGHMPPHYGMPAGHLPVRSYLAVPVVSRSGEVIGGLFFGHPEAGVFTERAERIIAGVAAQAAVAIDNARLYEDVKRAAQQREQLLDAERAARSEAERISLMKDEFLATLSHELRTPLNAILGWAQILTFDNISADDLHEGLETIQRNARAQAQLIDDLLDMSRIISGKVRLDVQQVNLTDVIDAAIIAVRPSAQAKGIHLCKVFDPWVGTVTGDPNRLLQVVWNLLTNAVKFTPKDGHIDVVVERVNGHVEITVRDSGVGIATEFLPHVFERFRQADSSTTRRYGGLGLGLSIVKQLVELHGGAIRVTSAGAGQGTTFTVTLPLASLRSHPQHESPLQAFASRPLGAVFSLAGIKVLVVDDEPDARGLMRRILTDCQAEVISAASADEALELLYRERPHVLVSDIGMPEKDGYQFIREVRSRSPEDGGETPAIALTAFARSEDRTRAMLAGYQIHTAKPIEPQELLATVASLAGRTPRPQSGP